MLDISRIDGQINGVEIEFFKMVQSFLHDKGIAISDASEDALKSVRRFIIDESKGSLTDEQTFALYQILCSLSPQAFTVQSRRFKVAFDHFRHDVESAASKGNGLVVDAEEERTSKSQFPAKHFNNETSFKKALERFGIKTNDITKMFNGYVVGYSVGDREKPIIIHYLDSHERQDHLNIANAVIEDLFAGGFNVYGAENVSFSGKEETIDSIRQSGAIWVRAVWRELNQCPSKDISLKTAILLKIPFSYIALKCYFGDDIHVFGLEDNNLLSNAYYPWWKLYDDELGPSSHFFGPGTYRLYDDFMKTAHERSRRFVSHLATMLDNEGYKKAVLVTGFAHRDSVKDALKSAHLNYIQVVPTNANYKIETETIDNLDSENFSELNFLMEIDNTETRTTKTLLEKALSDYPALSKYIYERNVYIVLSKAGISRSKPLTINTAYNDDLEMLISTFVHEQMHNYLFTLDDATFGILTAELEREFPFPPDDILNPYTHLIVCYLEHKVMKELFGLDRAVEILQRHKIYRWVYEIILNQEDFLARIIDNFGYNLPEC